MSNPILRTLISEMIGGSLPSKLDYDYHSFDSDRNPEAPHIKNLRMINARQKEHKAKFSDKKYGAAHKELYSALEDAKNSTEDHLHNLKRSGAFGVSDYKGDNAISKLRKYNVLLNSHKKKLSQEEELGENNMSNPILRTLISEMIGGSYLEEETALSTAKNLQKHFETPGDIESKKHRSTYLGQSIYSQQHSFTLNAHHNDVKKHLIQNGWKYDDFMDLYDHPTDGNKHRIKITKGKTPNTTKVEVAKSGRFPTKEKIRH